MWRTLHEIGDGGGAGRIAGARAAAWTAIAARNGGLPGIRMADKTLDGVTCIRLDVSIVICHSEKEHGGAQGQAARSASTLLAHCDKTGLALTGMDKLAAELGRTLVYSVGWELGAREREAIRVVPGKAWQVAVDAARQVRGRRADQTCGSHQLRAPRVRGARGDHGRPHACDGARVVSRPTMPMPDLGAGRDAACSGSPALTGRRILLESAEAVDDFRGELLSAECPA